VAEPFRLEKSKHDSFVQVGKTRELRIRERSEGFGSGEKGGNARRTRVRSCSFEKKEEVDKGRGGREGRTEGGRKGKKGIARRGGGDIRRK
jgi:hypothetical protein